MAVAAAQKNREMFAIKKSYSIEVSVWGKSIRKYLENIQKIFRKYFNLSNDIHCDFAGVCFGLRDRSKVCRSAFVKVLKTVSQLCFLQLTYSMALSICPSVCLSIRLAWHPRTTATTATTTSAGKQRAR